MDEGTRLRVVVRRGSQIKEDEARIGCVGDICEAVVAV